MTLVEARPVRHDDEPANDRRCRCGRAFLAVAVYSDGRKFFYFCPTCDVAEFKRRSR